MRVQTAIMLHWILFGLALGGAAWVLALGYLDLDRAFDAGDLTRRTLYESLTYVGAVLALLWAAGWVVASRPKAPPRIPADGYTYA